MPREILFAPFRWFHNQIKLHRLWWKIHCTTNLMLRKRWFYIYYDCSTICINLNWHEGPLHMLFSF
jgi:hypothetical protein